MQLNHCDSLFLHTDISYMATIFLLFPVIAMGKSGNSMIKKSIGILV